MADRFREAHTRSFVKAVSWRITGSMKFAGGIASAEMVTKVVLYYLHERGWALVPWGRKAHPELAR
jgi:uncharacterized membrane protein